LAFLAEVTCELLLSHLWQVWLKSVQRFQRRRVKCEKLTDGWTLTQDKSSHGLWPGELKSIATKKGWKVRGMIIKIFGKIIYKAKNKQKYELSLVIDYFWLF
jgi:hypothetical protein